MGDGNLSAVTEFIFTGFLCFQDGGLLYFVPLLFIYTFIIFGNLLIFAVRPDTCLHNPMYSLMSIFTFLEMWYTTAAIPLRNALQSDQQSKGHLFHWLPLADVLLASTWKHWRSLADRHGHWRVCGHLNPLHYLTIMTPQLRARLSAGSCIFGFLILLPEIVWISTLPFCGPN